MEKQYLLLFHGRTNPDENMDDWGETGPAFGPLKYLQGTYATDLKFEIEDKDGMCRLMIVGDCIYYDGMYYGDWTTAIYDDSNIEDFNIVDFDYNKAIPPEPTQIRIDRRTIKAVYDELISCNEDYTNACLEVMKVEQELQVVKGKVVGKDGKMPGSNDTLRDAWMQEHYPEEMAAVYDAKVKREQASGALEVARQNVYRIKLMLEHFPTTSMFTLTNTMRKLE